MKARILTAILLMFAFTAYNQTSRRGQQDNEKKTTQRTNDNGKQEETKRTEKSVKRSENTQNNEGRKTYNRNDNNQKSERVNTRDDNRNTRPSTEGSRRDPDNKVVVREQRNEPERKVVVHEYNREPQHKVVVRDNRSENRTYVRIDRPVRKVVIVHHPKHYHPASIEVRRAHNPYRVPVHSHVYWSVSLHNDFRLFYPEVRAWRYEVGYRLPVAPAYDAEYYIGDVARIYGKVYDVYYEYETDEYYLYFGDYFPYHDFSVVVSGREARAYSRRPERFFSGSHIAVTGYVTDFENKPEIVVRRASQIEVY